MSWEFWVDRGGTFTDIVAQDSAGGLHSHKLLSENPEQYNDAAVAGIRHILGDTALEEADIAAVKMGTTVATKCTTPELRILGPLIFSTVSGGMASEYATAFIYEVKKSLTGFAFEAPMQACGVQYRNRIKLF